MKLRYSPASPYVRKVMIVAHEGGLADRIQAAEVLVQQDTVNVDQGDSRVGGWSFTGPDDGGRHLAGVDGRGELDIDGASERGVSHDPGISPKRRRYREDMATAGQSHGRETGQEPHDRQAPEPQSVRGDSGWHHFTSPLVVHASRVL